MPIPLIAASLISSIPSLIKSGVGLSQLIQSSKYAKEKRPDYEIPDSVRQALESAKQQALQTQIPGQELAEQKLAGSTASAIAQSKQATDSPASILGQVSTLAGQEQESLRDLAIAAGENYNTNQATLRSQLGNMATQEALKWQWDKQMPYTDAMTTASNLQEAGGENVMAGLSDIAGSAFSAATTDAYLKNMKEIAESNNATWLKSFGIGDSENQKQGNDLMSQLGLSSFAKDVPTQNDLLTRMKSMWNPKKSSGFNTSSILDQFRNYKF
jgi:hypothetical protein